MEVRPGYKMTEIGIIPEDWEVDRVKNMTQVNPECLQSSTSDSYRFNYISIDDVNNGTLLSSSEILFSKAPSRARRIIRNGDVLISTVRPYLRAHLMFEDDSFDWICSTGFAVLRNYSNPEICRYIYHYFMSSMINLQIETILIGSNYPAMNSKQVKELAIPYPKSMSEIYMIVRAIEDIDSLISSLEKLIVKKKLIKQGVMQELLTGKRRLPGFKGEWVTKRLGEIGNTYSGITGKDKNDFENGNTPYIPFLNILNNTIVDIEFVDYVKTSSSENHSVVKKGDLLFNGSSETPEEVGLCSYVSESLPNLLLNSFCFGFRLSDSNAFDGIYLSNLFRIGEMRNKFLSISQGSTRYNLSKTYFNDLTIILPRLSEQRAISAVITDIEKEIRSLEQQLSKYKLLKQGMMEELLTGRIRLV